MPNLPKNAGGAAGCELEAMTAALSEARSLAMKRMEEEAAALGADGIVGVRLTVNLALNPQRQQWEQYRVWSKWSKQAGFKRPRTVVSTGWFPDWLKLAWTQWETYCRAMGWPTVPPSPWSRPSGKVSYALGANVAEFIALGTAVKHRDGGDFRNAKGQPFQSDLSGQDFWLLIRSGYRPVGFVMGNCVYYVPPKLLNAPAGKNTELSAYTHALYDARELAIERLQDEAEDIGATGVVGVTVSENSHSWRTNPWNVGNAALQTGEVLELFVIGTAVVPTGLKSDLHQPALVFSARDVEPAVKEGGE